METLSTPLVSLPFSKTPEAQNPKVDNRNRQCVSLIDNCTSFRQLKQIHAHMLRTRLFFDPYSASRLFAGYSLSGFSSLEYARKVFDEIPEPNLYTWNTLMRVYSWSVEPGESVKVFVRMLSESCYEPNKFTFPFLIKAAAELSRLRVGQVFHGMVVKFGFSDDVFVLNSLIHFYASCGNLDFAFRVFARIGGKDVVSWNSMISGFVQGGSFGKALKLFREMVKENVKTNAVTMVGVLSACAKMKDLEFGRWACGYIERNGIRMDLTLCNAMLDMYVKCGSVEDAKNLFDEMQEKDIVSWTTMIDGYAKLGEYDVAKSLLAAVPEQNIAAWNALISAYDQNEKPEEALVMFRQLQENKNLTPDELTFVSVLSSCAELGAMDVGMQIHEDMKKRRMKLSCHLATSLIDMYSKSGDLGKAVAVFHSVSNRDVFVWSTMIAALAIHGRGRDAINLFFEMQQSKVKPNGITFTNVLCACSHTGLVEEGKMIFNKMEPVYGVAPGVKHYACMVDSLGRAGFLKEALEFIEKMPITPSASVWGALLGACKIHENVELAELASSRLLELEPENNAALVLLSNIYAKTGKWDNAAELRKRMRVAGVQKERGCSSIEANGIIHKFLAADYSHPLSKEIYSKLDEIVAKLKSSGYETNKDQLLQIVEEDDMKEQALNLHSEKLAMAFGLINTNPSQPIRIVKNLRVCCDCHEVAKLVSKLYNREILLRDRYRFHCFRDGNCSCKDYW